MDIYDKQREIETEMESLRRYESGEYLSEEKELLISDDLENCEMIIDYLEDVIALSTNAKSGFKNLNMYSYETQLQTMIDDVNTCIIATKIHKKELEE
jgi:hypothetical protein